MNLLLGVRDIRFVRRRALDAITATQDVPLGVQIGLQAGHSAPILGAKEKDLFFAGDLYVGLSRSERATTRLQTPVRGTAAGRRCAVGRPAEHRPSPASDQGGSIEPRRARARLGVGIPACARPFSCSSACPREACAATRSRRSPAASASWPATSTGTRTVPCATWATSASRGSSMRGGNGLATCRTA